MIIKAARASIGLLLIAPCALLAQAVSTSATPSPQPRDNAVQAMMMEWRTIASNISKSAELMPDSSYSYRPVATVMTFGELLVHVSFTQYSTCASVMGVPTPADSARKQGAGKAELRRQFDASVTFCNQAYQQNLTAMSDQREQSRRYFGLAHNTAHINEHYGNMVTYLRILGFVPPSSQR